jgi:hypothetical protein
MLSAIHARNELQTHVIIAAGTCNFWNGRTVSSIPIEAKENLTVAILMQMNKSQEMSIKKIGRTRSWALKMSSVPLILISQKGRLIGDSLFRLRIFRT